MIHFKTLFYMIKLVYFIIISLLLSCSENKAELTKQPTLTDYTVGEIWTWKYKGLTTEGEVRSDGEDTREIVSEDGVLYMLIENPSKTLSSNPSTSITNKSILLILLFIKISSNLNKFTGILLLVLKQCLAQDKFFT